MNRSQLARIEPLSKLLLILFPLQFLFLVLLLVTTRGEPVEEAVRGEDEHVEEEQVRPVGRVGDHLGELVGEGRDAQEAEQPEDAEVGAH
jgi:hypothetical protein